MARLAVLVDRPPHDPEWKGTVAWNIILALAEAQHEVLALTTCDLNQIEVQHPRLNMARPASSFGLQYIPRWLRAIFQFQPQVIHTFGLKNKGPKALTVWPMLESGLSVMPNIRRYSTAFSEEDLVPFKAVTAPFELPLTHESVRTEDSANNNSDSSKIIIPAPVSEWPRWQESILLLNEFLLTNRELNVQIIGGWGDLTLSDRRAGWQLLENVVQQVHMTEPMDFTRFTHLAKKSGGIWLRPLAASSWRAVAAAHVAKNFALPTWGDLPNITSGSTANFLSRLYSQ